MKEQSAHRSAMRVIFASMLLVSASLVSAPAAAQAAAGKLVHGKYGCTASKYRGGSYEYIPRGFFTVTKDGKYAYEGFEKPSKGSFTVSAQGNLAFKGGYLDGGQAEKIDRPNKFFLVFPSIPDNRWTCGLVEQR